MSYPRRDIQSPEPLWPRRVLARSGFPRLSCSLLRTFSLAQRARVLAQSKTWRLQLAGCFLILHFAFCLQAWGQYSIDWSTTDGGGGTSTGGAYSITDTIDQPDAGTMSGGTYTLQGGFWPGMIVPSTGASPTLYIQRSGDSVIISWSPATEGFALEATIDLVGAAWTAAPSGNPVTIPITGPAKFYRLRKP